MPRPTVLVATTNPVMAHALSKRLADPCKKLGLKLEVCPQGGNCNDALDTVPAYESAEDLFDCLADRPPMELADTLVVLDVGAGLERAFSPADDADEGWHMASQKRAGVAVELILRFPQIFPVFLSPAVPVPVSASVSYEKSGISGVVTPTPSETSEKAWRRFHLLKEAFSIAHKENSSQSIEIESFDALPAFCVPLHFVSPLDQGAGLESTLARFARGMRCWFDPTGLRTLVKNRFLGTLFGNETDWHQTWDYEREPNRQKSGLRDVLLERLKNVAIAVDEEREFAMLNAYASYKFGRRAWLITTYTEFDDNPLWVQNGDASSAQMDVVVLRDIDLRFPDIPTGETGIRKKLTNLDSDKWKNKLGDAWRIRVVSSHPNVGIEKEFCDNCGSVVGSKYNWTLRKQRCRRWPCLCSSKGQYSDSAVELHYLGLSKPISTLYNLAGQMSGPEESELQSLASRLEAVKEDSSGGGGHGAPYLNLAMAESLLRQAGRCDNGPVENLIGALLAGESYELLLGMSKTTALEALVAMHKHEVAAEVSFPGISQDIDISPRKKDIEKTISSLYEQDAAKDADPGKTEKTKNLFLSRFWADLRPVYRDAELFEPAEAANRESLIYARWFGIHGLTWLKRFLVRIATGLGALFGAALVMWIFLTGLYVLGKIISGDGSDGDYWSLFRDVVLTSLALQPTDSFSGKNVWGGLLLLVHICLSYVLFGLLVSNLHRKITRG